MSDDPAAMRSVASLLSYNDLAPVPSAKHLLISAASQIESLQENVDRLVGLLKDIRDVYRDHDGPTWDRIDAEIGEKP